MFTAQGEEYSDNEGGDRIDMEVVPEEMGESAPTGLLRDRSLKAAGVGAKKKADKKPNPSDLVKPEPTSPEQAPAGSTKKGKERADDTLMDVDENLDLDESGARIDEDGHVAQPIDQEDSDDEEFEESMKGDFAPEEGMVRFTQLRSGILLNPCSDRTTQKTCSTCSSFPNHSQNSCRILRRLSLRRSKN
jgi:hypothetical protein